MFRLVCSFLTALSFLLLLASPSLAIEKIDSFHADVHVGSDATVTITETIQYDFGTDQRHGIFREIPVVFTNKDGKRYKAEFSLNSVTNAKERPLKHSILKQGFDQVVKIGHPDVEVTGLQTYVINYTMRGPVQYYSDHDELYWNVTGTEWDVPIGLASATVQIESAPELKTTCFVGSEGSTNTLCTHQSNTTGAQFRSSSVLTPSEGLTIAVSFPKGIVEVHEIEPAGEEIGGWVGWGILGIVILGYLILPAAAVWWWWRSGRDPKIDKTIVRVFNPPKNKQGRPLTPMEVGTLVDEVIHPRDVSAEIIHLAIKKYIRIKEHPKKLLGLMKGDIEFFRGKAYKEDPKLSNLTKHEKALFSSLTLDKKKSVKINDIKKSFPKKLSSLQNDLYDDMVTDGLFPENPKTRRNWVLGAAFVSIFIGGIPLAIVLFILSRTISRRTLAGAIAKRYGLGMKAFLDSQDRQLKFQEDKYYLFEKLLPYAISFGVAKVWAERFSGMTEYKPDWYESSSANSFTTAALISSLNNNLSTIQSSYTATSTSSSSGFSSGFSGGSVGGGFGGGGGGSW